MFTVTHLDFISMITRIFQITLIILILFFLVIAVLSFSGGLTFGTGLGDVVYPVTLLISVAILLFK